MKVLVTGAAGFIGSHIAEGLKKNGYDVIGIDNFSDYYSVSLKELNAANLTQQGIDVIKMDLREEKAYDLIDEDFDFILHFAGQPGISATSTFEDYLTNNVIATQKLINFAYRNKNLKHFFNIGTSSIYGLEATFPETTVPQPASHYGVTKLAAEQLVLAESRGQRLRASSLRLFSVYGPRERPEKLYTKLIACGFKNIPFPLFEGSENHRRSFTYVGDIVLGILSAIKNHEKVNGEIINLGNDEEQLTQTGIEYVEELLGKKIELQLIPKRLGDQSRTSANIEKAKRLLNYDPKTSLKEGLRYQIAWYKDNFL